jgi:hypothetical protein
VGGTFIFERSIKMEPLDWCKLGWVCGPARPGPNASPSWKASYSPAKGRASTIIPIRKR